MHLAFSISYMLVPYARLLNSNTTLVTEGGIWTCEALNMANCKYRAQKSSYFQYSPGVSFADNPNACGGGACIEAGIDNQNAPNITMHLYADVLLDNFEIGKTMSL
jgi:hypothetical protein